MMEVPYVAITVTHDQPGMGVTSYVLRVLASPVVQSSWHVKQPSVAQLRGYTRP